jgi:hypothetical protein
MSEQETVVVFFGEYGFPWKTTIFCKFTGGCGSTGIVVAFLIGV